MFTVLKGKTHQPRIFRPMKLPKEKKWYSQTKTCSAKTVEKKFLRKKENYIGQRLISTHRKERACVRASACTRAHTWMPSHVRLFATPWTVASQAPLSMEFSWQEYWSESPFPPPGDLPDPGIKLSLLCHLHCRQSLPLSYQERAWEKK